MDQNGEQKSIVDCITDDDDEKSQKCFVDCKANKNEHLGCQDPSKVESCCESKCFKKEMKKEMEKCSNDVLEVVGDCDGLLKLGGQPARDWCSAETCLDLW